MASLGLFSCCLFVLSNSDLLIFILFYYYSLEVCLFSNESKNGVDPDGKGGGEIRKSRGRKAIIINWGIYYVRKNMFSFFN